MSGQLTLTQLERVLPKSLKSMAKQDLVDKFNNIAMDNELKEAYRENLLGYVQVLQNGRFHFEKYFDAVRYVTYKLMGCSNIEAYVKTFPDRYQEHINNGVSDKDIASYVTSYNKNKLVNLIYEQTLIPTYVLNADVHQQAINVQAKIMNDPNVSPKVRSDAANSLLTHLKMPETSKVELDVTVKEDKVINDLRETTMALAAQQRKMLEAGAMNTKEVAESRLIIDGEVVDE